MVYLTETHKIEILMLIGVGDRCRTYEEVRELFMQKYPDLPAISKGTISKIEKHFREFGHVRILPRKRKPTLSDDVKLDMLLTIQENPQTPSRQIARDNDTTIGTVLKCLHSEKMHPYKLQCVQELSDDDADRRLEFCEQMMGLLDQNRVRVENILFSDESTFTLNGEVNRQNCRYWAAENPRWIRENHTQRPQKINVWAGIVRDRIIGPKFFEENLNGNVYLEFLEGDLIPALATLYPNALEPDVPDEQILFQQDGAPPHYAIAVRNYLNDTFPGRWIGRRGPIEWPARSPDLTPLDYFLWGYLKDRVYKTKPNDLEELKARITHEIREISAETVRKVQQEFFHRLGCCQERNGYHFEHLLR